jgi:hypothetical protein
MKICKVIQKSLRKVKTSRHEPVISNIKTASAHNWEDAILYSEYLWNTCKRMKGEQFKSVVQSE